MISKRKIIAIAAFLLMSLFMFTFANPSQPLDSGTAPVITVEPTLVKIIEKTDYDVMTGVSVTDDRDTLTAEADVTDTTGLSIGEHTITYTATDNDDNVSTVIRTIDVLDPNADEDGDDYTNQEELDANTDFDDPNDYPNDDAPVVRVVPTLVKIMPKVNYNVMTGVTVTDDFDIVTVSSNITDTTVFSIGNNVITYTSSEDRKEQSGSATRTIRVLDPLADEDGDGYTNGEEYEADTDYDNEDDYPDYDNAPTINQNNINKMEVFSEIPVFTATATDVADEIVDVVITHNIDNTAVGPYTVTFTATDSLGNVKEITMPFNVVDTTKPTFTVSGNPTLPTNNDVTLVVTATDNSTFLAEEAYSFDGGLTYQTSNEKTFTSNQDVIIVAKDKEGNISLPQTISITQIDKNDPIITIGEYETNPTNEDVIVTATVNEGTLNTSSHTFTENGTFTFTAIDEAGNSSSKTVTITNIDKEAPTGIISYDKTTWTNGNVVATLTPSEDVTVTNNGGSFTYEFTQNGTFKFNFIDEAGNTGSATATVSNIDKVKPTLTIKTESIGNAPYFNKVSFKLFDTNLKEAVLNGTLLNKSNNAWGDVNNVSVNQYYGVEGENTIIVRDKAGNETTYVFYLDITAPIITIGEYETNPTNEDVIVTATVNEGTLNTSSHTFTENGTFTFTAIDEAGNSSSKTVTITNIDKEAPRGLISYDKTTWTNTNVIAKLTPSEDVTVTNNGGSFTYEFTTNGTFTFNFVDAAGNTGSATATVSNIDKVKPALNLYDGTLRNNESHVYVEGKGILDEVFYTFRAYDYVDLHLEDKVIKTYYKLNIDTNEWEVISSIDTKILGSYKITYDVSDSAGNAAITRTRLVTVRDTVAPNINLYDNGVLNNSSIATIELGDEFNQTYYSYKAHDAFDGGMFNYVIKTYYKLNTLTNVWEEISSIDTNILGNYKVTYNVSDKSGNAASTKTRLVNVVDTKNPTGTISYSITTLTNGNVVATLTPSEDVAVTNNGGSFTYEFTENGRFTFNFVDAAGNTGSATATVSNIDKEAPTITQDNDTEIEVFDSIPVFAAAATDVVDGVVGYEINHNIDNTIAGTYIVTFTAIDTAGNQTKLEIPFEVTKRNITVSIDDKSSVYGSSIEELTYTVTSGTEVTPKAGISLVTLAAPTSNFGEYAITGTASNSNYNVTFIDGTYEITKKTLEQSYLEDLLFTSQTFGYNGTSHSIFVTGLPSDLEVSYTNNTRTNAGSHTATATISGSNYNGSINKTATITVNKSLVTVSADDKTSVYGSPLLELTHTKTGTVYGTDDLNVKLTTTATETSNVGTYNIDVTASNSNYEIILKDGTYEITAAPVLLNRIIATLNPVKYYVGDDIGSLTVVAYYSDSTSSIINSGYTYTPFDSSSIGLKTMTVEYQGKTATINYEILKKNANTGFIVLTNQFNPNRIYVQFFAGSKAKDLYYKFSTNYYGTQNDIKTNIFENTSIVENSISISHATGSDYYGYIDSVQTGFYYVYAKDASGKTEGYEVIYRP